MPTQLAKKITARIARQKAGPALKREFANFTTEKFNAAKTLRQIFEIKWYITRSFIKGEQYVFWNRGTGSLDRHRGVDPRRVRMVDNKLLHHVRKQQSKLLRVRPKAEVLPNSSSLEDRDAAKIGTKLLDHLYRVKDAARVSREIANWIYTTGNAIVVDAWDKEARGGGDVHLEVDSPFSWYVPAVAFGPTEFKDMPWAIRAKLRDIQWIEDTYNFKATPESFTADQTILLLQRDLDQSAGGLDTINFPAAVIRENWIKPNKRYPRGAYWVTCNDKTIFQGKFPNYGTEEKPLFEFPTTHFRDIIIPGQFWGVATAEMAIPLQQDWNRIRSSIIEWTRIMAKGKWIAPTGSGLAPTAIDNEHGEVIYYSPVRGIKPEQAKIYPLPGSVLEALELNKKSFMDLFAQHEVTSATNKSDIRSGYMVALLLEQDDTAHAMTFQDFEDKWADLWRHVLMLAQKYYTNTRTLKITGVGKEPEVMEFKGADLRGNTDVYVATGTHLPDNRLARQGVIMERYEAGLYGPMEDPQTGIKVRRLLDESIKEDVYDDVAVDQDAAMTENRYMRLGLQVPLNEWDNDPIHLSEHLRDVKSREVQALIREDGGAQVLQSYMEHIQRHKQKVQEQQNQQMLQLQAMGPQAAAGGGAPPGGRMQ